MSEHKHKARYGEWSGNPKGNKPDHSRCAMEVAKGYLFFQCSRKSGHGPSGIYCKQHAKRYEGAPS